MNDLGIRFGKRLRKLRLSAELTQEQLASQARISVDFLSLIERGINSPSFGTLEKIANALGVLVKELFSFEDQDL
jgi:transcriptional regulator with XRE-family HTH domain